MTTTQKRSGSYYTPDHVARALVAWLNAGSDERLLDPSCGDGRFLVAHGFSVGVEQAEEAAAQARLRAPAAIVHTGDFFRWAAETSERFECVAGNPPFIRYQSFNGEIRARAQRLCRALGVSFSGLASSWAPFLVAAASLLKPGGRMAFVVPAEIGHAPYAAPLLEFLVSRFRQVRIVAIRDKLFPELSEDCWFLLASGAGGRADEIEWSAIDSFHQDRRLPPDFERISISEWRDDWRGRLRPFILPRSHRELYRCVAIQQRSKRLGELARIGIGYVSGANDFFHLRPSTAAHFDIPEHLLQPAVRNGRALPAGSVTTETVENWKRADQPVLLLRLPKNIDLPRPVKKYLETKEADQARTAYKCRTREPWWSVPDVLIPDLMLTYMSGLGPSMVRNPAGCSCTNSLHAVRVKPGVNPTAIARAFSKPFTSLSCELEGHPLGGGMLKLEVREAAEVVIAPDLPSGSNVLETMEQATRTMRSWRHHGP